MGARAGASNRTRPGCGRGCIHGRAQPAAGQGWPVTLILRVKVLDSWCYFFFSSRRRHTRFDCDWSSDVCSSDLEGGLAMSCMRWVRVALAVCTSGAIVANTSLANEPLEKDAQDRNQWVLPLGSYRDRKSVV